MYVASPFLSPSSWGIVGGTDASEYWKPQKGRESALWGLDYMILVDPSNSTILLSFCLGPARRFHAGFHCEKQMLD